MNMGLTRPSLALVLNVVLLLSLAVTFGIYARAEKTIDRVNEQRLAAFDLAEELRRTSDDLTGMVRTYIVTGNPAFKNYYDEVMGIRDGKRPRPEQYQSIYWDLVISERLPKLAATGKPISLLDLARRTGAADEEIQKLVEAKVNSDRLTATELAAMKLMETTGPDREADRVRARLMVFDDRYRQAKADIIMPINDFRALMDRRTRNEVRAAEERATLFRGIFIACGLGLLVMLWRTYRSQRVVAEQLRMLDNIPTAIAALTLGRDGRVLFVNEQFVQTFGYIREDIPTLSAWEERAYPDPAYRAVAAAWLQRGAAQAVRLQAKVDAPEAHVTCKDGTVRDVMVSAIAMDDMLLVSLLDVSERRAVEERLRISEERHRLWADNSLDIIWTMGLDGALTYISPSVERFVGYTPAEFMRLSLDAMFTPASCALVTQGLARAVADVHAGRAIDFTAVELEHLRKDGSLIWVEITATGLYDRQGRFLEILGITRNIDARKQNERELEQARIATDAANRALQVANAELQALASTDALTGVWNRRHFEQAAHAAIARARRYAVPVSLILFDIDYFKAINDRYGHQTGDLVLIEMARRVGRSLRDADVLARWGGEEFMVLMPHCGEREAVELAEKLRGLLAGDAFPGAGRVTASFGVTEWARAETLDIWTKRVDDALYQAKDGGRNRVVAAAATAPATSLVSLSLTWRDLYACGEPAIDDEHRELFRLANRLLHVAIAEPSSAALSEAWDALLAHAVEHFAHEEAILRSLGYPQLEHHAGLHRDLVAHALELRGQVENGGCDFGTLVDFLARELVARHMLEQDRIFFPLFTGRIAGRDHEAK